MIINIRGTGGSGKSTVVTRIMGLYKTRVPIFREGRKRPIQYLLEAPGKKRLLVPGHYEIACGGCDTLKTLSDVFELITDANDRGYNVLCEGIMLADDVLRTVPLSKTADFRVILLTTPVEDCIAAIRSRREDKASAAGKIAEPLNEKNTRNRYESHKRICGRLQDAGVKVSRLDREAAFQQVSTWLEFL